MSKLLKKLKYKRGLKKMDKEFADLTKQEGNLIKEWDAYDRVKTKYSQGKADSLFAELKKSGRDLPLIPSLDEIFDKQVEFFINKPSSSLVNIELELFDHDQSLERLEIPVIEDRFET